MIIYLQTNTGIVEIPWKMGDLAPFHHKNIDRNRVQDVVEVYIPLTTWNDELDIVENLLNTKLIEIVKRNGYIRFFGDTAKFIAGNL